jgi:hypothetical protein
MITMIDVGITVPGKNEYNLWPSPVPFHKAFLSVTNIVFAYGELEFDSCAILADLLINSWARRFLQLHQRVQKSQRLSQSTFLLQISDISMYIVVAVVVYRYAGNKVSSPALGSAGKVVSKVAYGIAIPTVCPSS